MPKRLKVTHQMTYATAKHVSAQDRDEEMSHRAATLMRECPECLCPTSRPAQCHCLYDVYGPDCFKRGRHEKLEK